MKTMNYVEMNTVNGGAHCKYCCQNMGWISYLVHGWFNSYHIMQKKLNRKCRH